MSVFSNKLVDFIFKELYIKVENKTDRNTNSSREFFCHEELKRSSTVEAGDVVSLEPLDGLVEDRGRAVLALVHFGVEGRALVVLVIPAKTADGGLGPDSIEEILA